VLLEREGKVKVADLFNQATEMLLQYLVYLSAKRSIIE